MSKSTSADPTFSSQLTITFRAHIYLSEKDNSYFKDN